MFSFTNLAIIIVTATANGTMEKKVNDDTTCRFSLRIQMRLLHPDEDTMREGMTIDYVRFRLTHIQEITYRGDLIVH